MTTSHHEWVFTQAWAEHQHIRMLLAQIEGLLGRLKGQRANQSVFAGDMDSGQLLRGIRDLLEGLRRRLALEGTNGEVAIELACDPRFKTEVSEATVKRETLERQIGQLADGTSDIHTEAQIGEVTETYLLVANDLQDYLSNRIDMLRRSVIAHRAEKRSEDSFTTSL